MITMADLTLTITQPTHGRGVSGPVALRGNAGGDTAGLFFKWFSSLNAAATQSHPEINNADHSITALAGGVSALGEFGSHALVLAATDQDAITLAAIKAVKRSAMAGGAPPAAPAPCVVHQVAGALMRTPAADGLNLSKSAATIEFLAPGAWLKPDPANASNWIANPDYQALNGLTLRLRLAPSVGASPANSADIALNLAALPFFHADDKHWLRFSGALPGNLGSGSHQLTLVASAGAASASVGRQVVLVA